MLCGAVLAVLILNDNILVHTAAGSTAVVVYRYSIKRRPIKEEMDNEGSTLLYKMLEDTLALANSVFLLALLSSVYGRESTAKHGTERHSNAHSTAPHGRAGHDTARHRTALRCAVQLVKLSGAGLNFFVLSSSWV